MEKQKVNELLDKAANDYASENQQHDLSAQYSAFIAGAYFFINQSIKNRFKVFLLSLTFNFKKKKEEKRNILYRCRRLRYPTIAMAEKIDIAEKMEKQNVNLWDEPNATYMECDNCGTPVNEHERCFKCNCGISKPHAR